MQNSILKIKELASSYNAKILVVSKNRDLCQIQQLYNQGFVHMGENRVQSLLEKKDSLPSDIKWHIIGHLQKNKVKYIAEFVELIHSVESISLLKTIDKEAKKHDRIISILLQVKVAEEESKFGISPNDLDPFVANIKELDLQNISIQGIMGMGTLTPDQKKTKNEFKELKGIFERLKIDHFSQNEEFDTLSMGMSGDYKIALEEGSTLLRLGSVLFSTITC